MTDTLKAEDVVAAAAFLGVTPAHVWAVADVESAGSAFYAPAKPIIRMEPHHFRRLTGMRFDESHPRLSHAYSQRRRYPQPANQSSRWVQFEEACALDRSAAIQSHSFGMFQAMGFNYRRCGFASAELFLSAHCRSAGDQLLAAAHFIKSQNIDDELRREDWAGFAAIYNGENYRSNSYDVKLARAYARRKRG